MFPKIGTKCDIQLLNRKDWEGTLLKARLADEMPRAYLMELPLSPNSSRVYVPQQGHKWRIYYLPTNESALFTFDTRVMGVVRDQICLVRIERPEAHDIHKIQRRDFLRMPIHLQVELEASDNGQRLYGTTLDISGGGMAVSCYPQASINPGDELKGIVRLREDDGDTESEVPVEVKVLRVKREDGKHGRAILYCQFTSLKQQHQAAIVRLCNERQRELHLKGVEE